MPGTVYTAGNIYDVTKRAVSGLAENPRRMVSPSQIASAVVWTLTQPLGVDVNSPHHPTDRDGRLTNHPQDQTGGSPEFNSAGTTNQRHSHDGSDTLGLPLLSVWSRHVPSPSNGCALGIVAWRTSKHMRIVAGLQPYSRQPSRGTVVGTGAREPARRYYCNADRHLAAR